MRSAIIGIVGVIASLSLCILGGVVASGVGLNTAGGSQSNPEALAIWGAAVVVLLITGKLAAAYG